VSVLDDIRQRIELAPNEDVEHLLELPTLAEPFARCERPSRRPVLPFYDGEVQADEPIPCGTCDGCRLLEWMAR
jgi:hypothetical protein